jgi:hypothetical protein
MRKWAIWAAVIGGGIALFHYDYLWRMQLMYWIDQQTEKLLRFIIP